MSEKIFYYNISSGKMYEDFFKISLEEEKFFVWKNFGQVIKYGTKEDHQRLNTTETKVESENALVDPINPEEYGIEIEVDLFPWYVNSFRLCYEDDPSNILFTLPCGNTVRIVTNEKFDTRSKDLPDNDYFYWINDWEYFTEYAEKTNQLKDDAVDYIQNWRRPELITNASIKMVVFLNDDPIYIGLLESETRKTYIDAFYRALHYWRSGV